MLDMDWWAHEKAVCAEGRRLLCGVDEAGRGCLAGPVFAAAVILPFGLIIDGLNDSKQVPPAKREMLFDIITEKAMAFAIGTASVEEIDKYNILNATYQAMNRAIEQLTPKAEVALIDGNRSAGITCYNKCIVGGDGKSASIAAASILAKVSRDKYMKNLAKTYPAYRFDQHKGYGTALHYDLLREHGPSDVHRQAFLKSFSLDEQLTLF